MIFLNLPGFWIKTMSGTRFWPQAGCWVKKVPITCITSFLIILFWNLEVHYCCWLYLAVSTQGSVSKINHLSLYAHANNLSKFKSCSSNGLEVFRKDTFLVTNLYTTTNQLQLTNSIGVVFLYLKFGWVLSLELWKSCSTTHV